MSEILADPLSSSCYYLFLEAGMQESQRLGPDLPFPRLRTRAEGVQGGSVGQIGAGECRNRYGNLLLIRCRLHKR
jgi:hypothetical protein